MVKATADLTDSGQAFNALTTHFGFNGFKAGKPPAAEKQKAPAGKRRSFRKRQS